MRTMPFGVNLVIVIALLLMAFGVTARSIEPPPPGSPDVFSITETVELDLDGVPVTTPKWSPDGEWIAYSLPKGNGIGLIRPDGTGRRILTAATGSGYRFAWSPGGDRLAFRAAQREHGPRFYAIRIVDVASGEIEETSATMLNAQPPLWQRGPDGERWITHGDAAEKSGLWRPDQTKMARPPGVTPLLLRERAQSLWLESDDLGSPRKVSGEFGLNPVWNRTGTRFAFDAMDQIAVGDSPLTESPRVIAVGQHPAWSPDGEWIAFQITRDHSHAPDDPRQHTPDTAPHLHDDKTNHQIVDSDLWIISADGTRRQQLTKTTDVIEVDPEWAPDGNAIVCRTEGSGRLLILKLERE